MVSDSYAASYAGKALDGVYYNGGSWMRIEAVSYTHLPIQLPALEEMLRLRPCMRWPGMRTPRCGRTGGLALRAQA